jgi:hypothetical protein
MRPLLAKDFRLVAPYLWAIVPAHMLWCAQSLVSPEFYFWTCMTGACGWTLGVVMAEWHFDTDRFVASLPVSRATIVKARYASAFSGLAAGAILFVVYGLVAMAVVPERLARHWPATPAWASADGVLAFLGVGGVLIAGFLPFFFRLGLPMGGGLFGATAAVVIGALAAAGRGTAVGPSVAVRGWLSSFAGAWGTGLALVIGLAAAGALGFVSVRLSVRFFEARDL